jgi:integrase
MFPKHQRPRLPKVLNTDQLLSLFQALRSPKYRAILMTCYAAGLRLGEACRLQIGDIDSSRMVIHVRQGKGNKERYTVLSPRLLHAAGLLEAISAHHVVVFRAAPKKAISVTTRSAKCRARRPDPSNLSSFGYGR